MANPHSSNQNGIVPHFHQQGYPQPSPGPGTSVYQQRQHASKPFTLNEALPYTPFTSVFPFEPDIISNPTIGSGPLAPSLAGLVSREDYDALNKEAETSSHSKRLEGSLEFVQHLLKTDKITHFQFKTAPKATLPLNLTTNSIADGISPFAKLVYDNTSISFRHFNPETSNASTPNGHGHGHSHGHGHGMSPRISKKASPKARRQEPPKVVKHNPATSNAQAVAQNKARIEIHLPTRKELDTAASIYTSPRPPPPLSPIAAQIQAQTVSLADLMVTPKPPLPVSQTSQVLPSSASKVEPETPTPQAVIPKAELPEAPDQLSHIPVPDRPTSSLSSVKHGGAIQIELPAASFDRNEFAVVPDVPEIPTHLSTKRKRAAQDEFEDSLGGELNQRELANAAFGDLRRCFQEIFSAVDYLSSERGTASHLITLTNDQEPTMSTAAHDKAHKQLNRAISLGCFRQAPLDDLLRIQNLSEGSLKHADVLDFKLDETWGETEVGFWVQQLHDIEMGLKAARTSFRIMCGGREERQLYSEDLIQQGLNLFRNVISDIIIPTAELRSTGPTSNLFRLLATHKKAIGTLFTTCQKVFSLMSDLIVSIDLSETVVHTLEFVASRLIFVENAHTEKDSVVGVQKFDALRMVAMNVLSQIFLMNPAQREGIFNEILTSLEKLPIGKQSARQFKLSEGKSIQPVSALIMRLIQASAGKVDDRKEKLRGQMMRSLAENDGNGGPTSSSDGVNGKTEITYTVRTEESAAVQHSTAIQELQALAKTLADGAYRNATYVVNFIVKRALKSTKSGDTPYRNLLDLFIEDFTTCLDSPDWPAAELLLRLTMYMMFQQVDGDKNAAPARNMALELLGVMAAAISRLRSHVRKTATNFEGSDSDDLGRWLADLTLSVLEGNMSMEKTVSWLGPYRVVLEHLQDRLGDDPYLKGAISYLITDWGTQVSLGYDSVANEESEERDSELGRIAFRLRNMIEDPKWLSREYSFKSVVPNHAKLSHSTILLRSSFCASFKNILNILMGSMTTDQATVRSRSLKSINLVLDTDPTILDGDSVFIQLILQCSNDSSPQVRDSALGLIGKCMAMRPRLEEKMTPTVIQRFIDSGIGVRKRAMKLAKDIYLGNESKAVRSTIANGLLLRTQDPDEGVRELARQMIEEVWISPFYKEDDSVAFKQAITDHVALMVQTVKQGNTALVLDKVFQTILSPDSKLAEANSRVCTRLVADLVDLIGNPESDDPSIPSSRDAFQVLMIFAKADPKLFTFEQIRQLQPHIASVSTSEDLTVSRAVVVIYRRVLPQVSSVHSNFLSDIRRALMPATSKVTRALLDDVVACLWIVSGLLETEPLARLAISCLKNIQPMSGKSPLDRTKIRQFDRYSLIVGMIGKHCSLDDHLDRFKFDLKLPKWKGCVSKLMVDFLVPFANPSQPVDVRRPALDAIGLVCQSNPRNYVSANVYTTFQQAFDERMPILESMILRSFKEFLLIEEQRSEQSAAGKESAKRDLKVMGGTSFDDVASATTQRFLKDITRIALATHDDHAFLAMEVLASINRQGLVHPKETGVTLITLETCPVPKISELAYHEHRALHEKYESVLEREYAKAIQSAFQYQRDVIKDIRGATENPFMSKLHLLTEVLKISKSKNRVRFLEKLIGQIDFDLSKLPAGQALSSHVEFSRFIIENVAFFEFVTIGELQTTITAMEKIVTGTGSGIAQAIESEIFHVRMDPVSTSQQPVSGEEQPSVPAPPTIDPQRLRQLTAGSVILLALWEVRTYLRRLYGLSSNRRESKGKAAPKDLAKSPVKVQGVTGDKFWDDISRIMSAFDTPEQMIKQCRAFVELLTVDNEVQVPDEEEEFDLDGEAASPDAEDNEDAAELDPRGRKRKAGNAPGGRKKRARSNSKPRPRGRPRKQSMEAVEADLDGNMEWI